MTSKSYKNIKRKRNLDYTVKQAYGDKLLYYSKSIVKPIKKATGFVNEIGKGHLSVRTNYKSKDEIGQMCDAINGLTNRLDFVLLGVMKDISEGDLNHEICVHITKALTK